MLDSVTPFELKFLQKESPGLNDSFDFAYIYRFYTEGTVKNQRLKYILRAEAYQDVFAIKFYAARDRNLDTRYNRILKVHNYTGTLRLFLTCASIIPTLLKKHPSFSFAVNGAESMDMESDKVESRNLNQRFRIYRNVALNLFGRETFEHIEFKEVSSYLLVNRRSCQDILQKSEEIKNMFLEKGFES